MALSLQPQPLAHQGSLDLQPPALADGPALQRSLVSWKTITWSICVRHVVVWTTVSEPAVPGLPPMMASDLLLSPALFASGLRSEALCLRGIGTTWGKEKRKIWGVGGWLGLHMRDPAT